MPVLARKHPLGGRRLDHGWTALRAGTLATLALVLLGAGLGLRPAVASASSTIATPPERGAIGLAPAQQIVPTADGHGYWIISTAGGVAPFGDAKSYGSPSSLAPGTHIVGMAETPAGLGYWEVGTDGGIFSYGNAAFFGSTGAIHLNQPIVGMAPTPDGRGYWLVAADGGIFAFGDAGFYGSTGSLHLNRPIVGMASTADGRGYWLVGSDGGIFAFGDAPFHGSTGGMLLNQPVTGLAVANHGKGYWLVAADGGIFAFGNAAFEGSMGGTHLAAPVVGMAPTSDGKGYWMVGTDGGLFAFGDAPFYGSLVSTTGAAGTSPTANPANSIPPTPNFLGACYPHTDAASCTDLVLQATNNARAGEGLGPMYLPSNFGALTPGEQLFVITDIERVDRGLPPFAGLDPTLSLDAAVAAIGNTDPTPAAVPPGMSVVAWGSNWGENGNPLGSSYYWMYDDGTNSGNLDCTPTNMSDCWGHRENILGLSQYLPEYGGTLLMGAAEDDSTTHGGWASDAELFTLATGPIPPQIYTWAQAVAAGAG